MSDASQELDDALVGEMAAATGLLGEEDDDDQQDYEAEEVSAIGTYLLTPQPPR